MGKISLSLNGLSEQQRCDILEIVEEALIDDSEDTDEDIEREPLITQSI